MRTAFTGLYICWVFNTVWSVIMYRVSIKISVAIQYRIVYNTPVNKDCRYTGVELWLKLL